MKPNHVKGSLALSLLLIAMGCGSSTPSATDSINTSGGTGTTTGGGGSGTGGSGTGGMAAGGHGTGGTAAGGHGTGGTAAGGHGTGGGTTSGGCVDDKQCGGDTPYCDKAAKTCVACVDENQCPDGLICKAGACEPGCSKTKPICGDAGTCDVATGQCSVCTQDSDCPDAVNPRCEVGSGKCVPCLPVADNCGDGKYCVELNGVYSCNNGCAKDSDCKADVDGGGAEQLACCDHVCIDTLADTKNCGTCGTACAVGGLCCTGACVDPAVDSKNCSACGKACSATNATVACEASACVLKGCDAGFADCDNSVANGCEIDTKTDPNNCSACAKACSIANGIAGCDAGACSISSCNDGFADCDKSAANGCEITTLSDAKNCGACGKDCGVVANGTTSCGSGVCAVTCNPGFFDCDANAGNGCEVNVSIDAKNCGKCGTVCPSYPNSTPGCANSACNISACTGAFLNCDLNLVNGCEVNGGTDVKSCGKCGNVCPAVANGAVACAAGACGIGSCNAGFKDCKNGYADGCETPVSADINNCGACNNKCAVANGTPGCTNSTCGVAACSAGFADCKNGYADGCETATTGDVNNCGACGKVCGAVANGTPGCTASACGVATCNAGFLNCDNNAANGCEANSNSDPKNCGACGNACASGVCTNGACKESILVVGAPATDTWNNDVQSKLVATAAFQKVDIFNAKVATPTLAALKGYQAVLVYSDAGFQDAATLGNNLADYFDAGGRVVIATFANASAPVAGRWASGNYHLIATGGQVQPAEAGALKILEPNNPLAAGVAKLTATAAYRSSGALINGGVAVAQWGSGAPLIIRGVKNGVAYAALNFYPPSSTVRVDFWAGDGGTIMKNALQYHGYCHSIVGKSGGVCPSGKVEYCDPAAPIVNTSGPQAKGACEACYGAACFLENADCAGVAYGPKAAGQFVCGDAYFGYAAGCSGGAGRIWSICSSNTTYGTWAP